MSLCILTLNVCNIRFVRESAVLRLQIVDVLAIPLFLIDMRILKFGISERPYFCTVNSIHLEFYIVCQFFFICVSLIASFF